MKKILLTQNQVAWVDNWNYEYLNQWKWYAWWNKYTKSFYARRSTKRDGGGQITIFMHRVIMNTPKGVICDHKNHDTLLNIESNLRNCTKTQNHQNMRKLSTNKSGYKGVSWDNNSGKYKAQISVNNKKIHIGLFTNPLIASKAYDKKAKELHGEFAYTNFEIGVK